MSDWAASWIIKLLEAGERLMSSDFSVCFIAVSYLGQILFCCTSPVFFSLFLSPLSYYLCFCHSAPWWCFFSPCFILTFLTISTPVSFPFLYTRCWTNRRVCCQLLREALSSKSGPFKNTISHQASALVTHHQLYLCSAHQSKLLSMQHQSCRSTDPLRIEPGQVQQHSPITEHSTGENKTIL